MTSEQNSPDSNNAIPSNTDLGVHAPAISILLGRFTAALAHDLRTPLSVIRNSVHLIRAAGAPSGEASNLLGVIDSEAVALNQSIARLLEIWHRWAPNPEDVELEPLATELIAELDRNRTYRWQMDFRNQRIVVWCDRVRFKHALGALFSNAMSAMKGSGDIFITARQEPEQHVIEVRDRGSGVPPELRTTLFDECTSSKRVGMGLGLTYCRAVVQRHLGTLTLAETSPAGTVFRIVLPRKDAHSTPGVPAATA